MLKEFINSINFYEIEPDRNFFHPISDRKYWDAFAKKHIHISSDIEEDVAIIRNIFFRMKRQE